MLPLSVRVAVVGTMLATLACSWSAPSPPAPEGITTIVAATMSALVTPSPPPPTVAPPSPSPTLTLAAPGTTVPASTRIEFAAGATTGVVTGAIGPGQEAAFVLQAGQGQPMIVQLASPNSDLTLSVRTQGGTYLLSPTELQSSWKGTLPQTEDYVLTIYGAAAAEDFSMTVEIVSRIKFAEGADSFKVSGETIAGYNVAYTVFAVKDQEMDLDLAGLNGKVALAVWGYADGQPYLRGASAKTHFSLRLPVTQDYILEVVPMAGKAVSYVLLVRIK